MDLHAVDVISHKLLNAAKSGRLDELEETITVNGFTKDAIDECGQNPLHHAVCEGNIHCVFMLLNLQCPLHTRDIQGRTPLFMACLKGVGIEIAHALLYNPDNFVNVGDIKGVTPLMIACQHSDETVVEALIQCGADLDIKDNEGHTAVWHAQKFGTGLIGAVVKSALVCNDFEGINRMSFNWPVAIQRKCLGRLRFCDNYGWNLFHWAASRDLSEYVDIGHELGCDPQLRDYRGRSPLHLACHFGASLNVVEKFFDEIADVVNDSDWTGMTPLMAACRIGSADLVERLLQVGASLYLTDLASRTALWYAKYYNRMDLYVILLQAGADPARAETTEFRSIKFYPMTESPNTYDRDGFTPLMKSCRDSNSEAVRKLLKEGANLEMLDGGSHSALWHADKAGNNEICQLLIEAGADSSKILPSVLYSSRKGDLQELTEALEIGVGLDEADSWGNSALHWAAMRDDPETLRALLEAGCSLTRTRNNWGATPLFMACICSSSVSLIKELVQRDRASVNIPTFTGKSPLMAACGRSSYRVVSLLINSGASVNWEDDKGCTPLFYAYMSTDVAIYRIMLLAGANPVQGDAALLTHYVHYLLHQWHEDRETAITLIKLLHKQEIKLSGDVYLSLNDIEHPSEETALSTIREIIGMFTEFGQVVHFIDEQSFDQSKPDVLTLRVHSVPKKVLLWICTQSAAVDPDDVSENVVYDLQHLARRSVRKTMARIAKCEKEFCMTLGEMQVARQIQDYIRFM